MKPAIAARLFAFGTAIAVLFQAGLVAGMPWGEFAWGGSFPGTLPPPMRAASVGSGLLLLVLIGVILVRAGLVRPAWQPASRKAAWLVVVFCGVSVVANAMTPSPRERAVWLPVTLLMLGTSIVVARSEVLAYPRA